MGNVEGREYEPLRSWRLAVKLKHGIKQIGFHGMGSLGLGVLGSSFVPLRC